MSRWMGEARKRLMGWRRAFQGNIKVGYAGVPATNNASGDRLAHETTPGGSFLKLPEWISSLLSHPFLRSVTLVAGGTAAAQLITIAFSPLITRLYGPEAFGALGIFMAVVSIISPIANLTYGSAIVLPASDSEARALFRLSALIGLSVSLLSAAGIGLFHQTIADAVGFTAASTLLLLVPLSILLSALIEPTNHWLYRRKQFKAISHITVVGAIASNGTRTVTGLFLATAPALIALGILANALELFLLWNSARPTLSRRDTDEGVTGEPAPHVSLKEVAYRYRDFPLFRAPNDWLNVVSNSIPSLLLAALFGPSAAGFYLLARRIVALPITVIAGAVGTVFLPRIVEASHGGERLRPLLMKGTAGLAAVGLIPFGIMMALGPWLFGVVFGAEWTQAGEYARWLALWFYCAFAAVPSAQVIPILGLQGHFLAYEIAVVALRAAALAAGTVIWNSDLAAIILFSLVGALVNLTQITWCLLSCDKRSRDQIRVSGT
ncbi:lipopolysaccharide biosynthesis protein [Microvirga sp. GCM10011540]|uniref:lipopolysaccharide biosynthesis protein n=1 Tax=Microvirga sp. GCM10011540 TaxID=3317338 RepID=UPI00361F0CE1